MNNHFDTPVTLVVNTRTQNANGYPVTTQSKTNIWGDLNSVKRTEFYSAEAQGHKLSYVLTIPTIDWNDAEQAIIDSKTYNIVRTYQKSLDLIDLTLEKI